MAEEVSISGGLPSIMGNRQPAIINTAKETHNTTKHQKISFILKLGL